MIDVKAVLEADRRLKSREHNEDAIRLAQLFDDQARELTTAFCRERGLGRPHERLPLEVNMTRRVVESLSVLYRTPPVRALRVGGETLDDTDPRSVALAEVLERSQYDLVWQAIDAARNLWRTVLVQFAPSSAHGCTQARVYHPANVYRDASGTSADTLEHDRTILLQISDGPSERDRRYEAWMRDDAGAWSCAIVDETGEEVEDPPYPAGLPWDPRVLPLLLVHDELPMGRAWLPIPQSRVSYALHVNGLMGDLAYLVQTQAHSRPTIATRDTAGAAGAVAEAGPDRTLVLPDDARYEIHTPDPRITECSEVIDQLLRFWSTAESLPGDAFRRDVVTVTGTALRVRERELEARRQRQVPLAYEDERRAYEKLRAVHNAYAAEWDLPSLDPVAELWLEVAPTWQPTDPGELQVYYSGEIALGAASLVDYVMVRDRCTRRRALETLRRVQVDRLIYPMGPGTSRQTPGVLATQQVAGIDATKADDAPNPDPSSAVEGASMVSAARAMIETH